MAVYRIAAVIKNLSDEDFLVVRQDQPPRLSEEEYLSYVDSDLWDLPSAPLKPLDGALRSDSLIGGSDSLSGKIDLSLFDVGSALNQVLSQVSIVSAIIGNWVLLKYVEEAEFGPEPLVHTLVILGRLGSQENLQESCKWISEVTSLKLLLEVKPCGDRIGPFVVLGLFGDSAVSGRVPNALHFQEYPPGITLVPMRSRTIDPFRTTNLVVVAPDNVLDGAEDFSFIARGEALLMDPGCCAQYHSELADLVAALPRKLVVFVTHHHYDHVDGLSVVQKCNPDAILLVHENTMTRIGKEKWSLRYILISGGEKISIGGQVLEAISAPGHTDGHLALLHVSTNSLIVGDHCVGQGSAVLDIKAGGNMKDYFETTYRFLHLSPHVIIPMHGRINLWPKRMLCGYLKHRRDRESSILKAIESGAETLFDIVSKVYGDLDIKLWLPASSNVRIHVDHLAYQQKLPKEFSMRKFRATCGAHFISRWIWGFLKRWKLSSVAAVLTVVGVGGLLAFILSRQEKARHGILESPSDQAASFVLEKS